MSAKAPNPVDRYVGSRVRMRRIMLGMSQEKLGEALGLTFQQVQKYEKGTNRVGASRLQQIAHILQVPVSFFFDGAPNAPGQTQDEFAEAPSPAYVSDFLATSDGLALTMAFMGIKGYEYSLSLSHHHLPKTSNFFAIYFTMTGLHGLHVLGGMVVFTYFLIWGWKMYDHEPRRFTNRIEIVGLYWHFVDLVWIFLFPTLYLL